MTYLSLEVVFGWVRITPVCITLGGFLLYFVQQKIWTPVVGSPLFRIWAGWAWSYEQNFLKGLPNEYICRAANLFWDIHRTILWIILRQIKINIFCLCGRAFEHYWESRVRWIMNGFRLTHKICWYTERQVFKLK